MQVEGLVSTVIPVHNRAQLLREAVRSVLAQTYRPIEITIVDDGSTDNTFAVAQGLAATYPDEIHCLRIDNSGPGRAREVGRLHVRGAFIQYLDSDDLIHPAKFEQQIAGLRAHSNCAVAYGKTRSYRLGEVPEDKPCKRTGEDIATMFPSFLKERWWDTSTPLYRREIIDRAGPWTGLRNEEDWEYDCRIAVQGVDLYNCREFVSDTRIHKGSHCSSDGTNPLKLADRAHAHELILSHAKTAGISSAAPEMRHFARELFLLSRQCGAAGLREESERLFHLARGASGARSGGALDFRLYRAIAETLGWRTAGNLAYCFDRVRGVIARSA